MVIGRESVVPLRGGRAGLRRKEALDKERVNKYVYWIRCVCHMCMMYGTAELSADENVHSTLCTANENLLCVDTLAKVLTVS